MSLLRIKIVDTEINHREGISTKNNKPYSINTQENVFIEINGEVRRLPLTLQDNASAYAPGVYQFDPVTIMKVGNYGLEVDRYKPFPLIPVSTNAVPNK